MTRHPHRRGKHVGHKRVRRLIATMGLRAIYQRPRSDVPHPAHRKCPYLLRDLVAAPPPNQVWCFDVTCIPRRKAFLCLMAIMDWATREVLPWQHNNNRLQLIRPVRLSKRTKPPLGHVDGRSDSMSCGGEAEETHEREGGLIVAGCDTTHLLEPVEHPLDTISVPIALPVCLLRSLTAFA